MISIAAAQADVGIVGARLWYPNDTLQHGGVFLGVGGVGNHAHKHLPKTNHGYFERAVLLQEFSAVTAACLLVKKNLFIEAEGFDETNLSVAFNDVDLCLKVKALGYRIIWTPYAELYHHESVSRGDDFASEKWERFSKENEFMLKKWGQIIQNDPAYSPNLSLKTSSITLAWPPRLNNEFDKCLSI
jgi:GT2 family glycosyltransferase